MSMNLRIGSINKAVELVCDVEYDTPIVVPEPLLDRISKNKPDAYLRYLESVYESVKEQRYVSYADGIVSLVCASVDNGVETTYRIDMKPCHGELVVQGIATLGVVALPSGCVEMRRNLRRRRRD